MSHHSQRNVEFMATFYNLLDDCVVCVVYGFDLKRDNFHRWRYKSYFYLMSHYIYGKTGREILKAESAHHKIIRIKIPLRPHGCVITDQGHMDVPVAKLIKGLFSENFRFAQWFKLFFEANTGSSPDYNYPAIESRLNEPFLQKPRQLISQQPRFAGQRRANSFVQDIRNCSSGGPSNSTVRNWKQPTRSSSVRVSSSQRRVTNSAVTLTPPVQYRGMVSRTSPMPPQRQSTTHSIPTCHRSLNQKTHRQEGGLGGLLTPEITYPDGDEAGGSNFQHHRDSSSSTNSLQSDGDNDIPQGLHEQYHQHHHHHAHQQHRIGTPNCRDKNLVHTSASPSPKRRDCGNQSKFGRPPPSPSIAPTGGQLHQPLTATATASNTTSAIRSATVKAGTTRPPRTDYSRHHQPRQPALEEPAVDQLFQSTPFDPRPTGGPKSSGQLAYFTEAIADQPSDKWSPASNTASVKTPTMTSVNSIQGSMSSTASSKCKKVKVNEQVEGGFKSNTVPEGDTGTPGEKKTLPENRHRAGKSNGRSTHVSKTSLVRKTSNRVAGETSSQSVEQAQSGQGSQSGSNAGDRETGAGDGGTLQEEVEALRKQVAEHRRYLFYSNKEAEFYYKKLREIEDVCNSLKKIEPKPHTTILKLFFEIIYETEVFTIVCIGMTGRCNSEPLFRFLLIISIFFSLGNVLILILYGCAKFRPLPGRSVCKLSIESLVISAGKKNHKANLSEIHEIIDRYKSHAEYHFLRYLFSVIDFSPYESKSLQKDFHQVQYLAQELRSLLPTIRFPSLLCHAIGKPLLIQKGFGPLRHLLTQISRLIKLTPLQEVILGLSLLSSSDPQLVAHAQQWLRQKLPDLLDHNCSTASADSVADIRDAKSGEQEVAEASSNPDGELPYQAITAKSFSGISIESLHFIAANLSQEAHQFGLSTETMAKLFVSLRSEFPRGRAPTVLLALLYPDILELAPAKSFNYHLNLPWVAAGRLPQVAPAPQEGLAGSSDLPVQGTANLSLPDPFLVADLLEELGPECSHTLEGMRTALADCTGAELTPPALAKCICLFMRTAEVGPPAGEVNAQLRSDNMTLLRTSPKTVKETSSVAVARSAGGRPDQVPDAAACSTSTGRTWDVENFVTVVREHNPHLSMLKVIAELDCDEFSVSSRSAFVLLKDFLRLCGNQVSSQLPTSLFYRTWASAPYGQFSLLLYCSSHPDVICLAYWPHHSVNLSLYQLTGQEDHVTMQIWKNVDYLQTILTLSDRGIFSQAYQLLRRAFHLYPDVLTASLLECVSLWSGEEFGFASSGHAAKTFCTLRSVLLGHALVYFLTPRINSKVVLQSAWTGCCKSSQLPVAHLQQQKHLFAASVIEYVSQLTNGCAEPSTLPFGEAPPRTSHSTGQNPSFIRLIDLLVASTSSDLLVNLLGTGEMPSSAVSPLILPLMQVTAVNLPQPAPPFLHLSEELRPSPGQALDLALVLLVHAANLVSSSDAGTSNSQHKQQCVQTTIRVFLNQWFTERLRDKHSAEYFMLGVVNHLQTRYASQLTGSPQVGSSSTSCVALPAELSKPSPGLLLYLLQSALSALKVNPSHLKKSSFADITQLLHIFSQNITGASSPGPLLSGGGSSCFPQPPSVCTAPLGFPGLSSVTLGSSAAPQQQPATRSQQQLLPVGSGGSSAMKPLPGVFPPVCQSHVQQSQLLQSRDVDIVGASIQSGLWANLKRASQHPHQIGCTYPNMADNVGSVPYMNAGGSKMGHSGGVQPGASFSMQLSQQRKQPGSSSSSGLDGSSAYPIPPDYAPIALAFSNEPIEIEMSKEVEVEAHSFFQKLLKGICPPDEMFKTIRDYASQGNVLQRQLLDGILRMLADEVSQHLQDYPEPMLPLISELYGSILSASTHLLPARTLSIMWRAVIARIYMADTLETSLFHTMMVVLLKAKNTIVHFMNLPSCLLNCPTFKFFPPELQDAILNADMFTKNYMHSHHSGSSKSLATSSAPGPFHLPSQQLVASQQASGSTASIPNTVSVQQQQQQVALQCLAPPETAVFTPPDPPEETTRDRVYFIINNLSTANIKEKTAELAGILTHSETRLLPWFAYYMIHKRVSVEQSFLEIFATVLDHLQEWMPSARAKVLQELIRSIKQILRGMRQDKDDMQARSSLKNLGCYLGLITLARNKPVLHDDLNIKDLIYEAYYKGPISTQYVIPFVARIVRGAAGSVAFRPPNPWTMAILKVFRELYDMRDVKDFLRFEIEILYRGFKMSLEDVPMATFLHDPSHFSKLEVQLCFLVSGPPTTAPASSALELASVTTATAVVTTTEPSSGGGAPAITTTSTTTTTSAANSSANTPMDLAPVSTTTTTNTLTLVQSSTNLVAQQQQQQHIFNIMAALQKQQQSAAAATTTSSSSTAGTCGPLVASNAGGLDFTNMMHSSLASGGRGQNTGASAGAQQQQQQQHQHALAIAAALAAIQPNKQGAGTAPPTAAAAAAAAHFAAHFSQQQQATPSGGAGALALQPQQLAAAMALLQQQQQQQQLAHHQMQIGGHLALPSTGMSANQQYAAVTAATTSTTTSTGSAFPGISQEPAAEATLRYEDVNLRIIRARPIVDEIVAVGSRGTTNTLTAAASLLQANPRIRDVIEPAIIKAIRDLTTPVFERCARITVTTVASVVRKDFALDPDPNHLLYAARQMVRHLAAGISLITARDALGMSLVTGLKNIILGEVQSASPQDKEAVQRVANLVVSKNMPACLAFMQKSVAEKAVADVEKRLETDIKVRNELDPRRFVEQAAGQLATQQASVPEALRLVPGGPTASEMAVYDEFARAIPGFASSMPGPPSPSATNQTSMMGAGTAGSVVPYLPVLPAPSSSQQLSSTRLPKLAASTATPAAVTVPSASMLRPSISQAYSSQQQHALLMQQQQFQLQQQQAPVPTGLFDKIIAQIERHFSAISTRLQSANNDQPMLCSLRCLIDALHLAKLNREASVAATVITTLVQSFLEHYRPGYWRDQAHGLETMEHLKEAHMLTLRHMLSAEQAPFGYAWVRRQVTQTWIHLDGGAVVAELTNPSVAASSVEASAKAAGEEKLMGEPKQLGTDAWYEWQTQHQTDASLVDTRLTAIKWNWEAFTELLKVHVVYLSQVDTYLAQEVSVGHPGAITFVIDLLDHFVLPCPTGTVVAAAAAAAATYARPTASSSSSSQLGAGAGVRAPTGSATSSTAAGGGVTVGSTGTSQQQKREFTVLNEYDLWATLEAMRVRVTSVSNSALSHKQQSIDPLGIRLRLACARVRGLLDLGLLENSPLFSRSRSGSGATGGSPIAIGAFYSGCSQAREFDDPHTLQEKVELLMRNWIEISPSRKQRDNETIDAIFAELDQLEVLQNLDNLTRFLRLATIFVIERSLKQLKMQEQQQQQQQSQPLGTGGGGLAMARVSTYVELDAYTRLVTTIVDYIGKQQAKQQQSQHQQNSVSMTTVVCKVLGIIVGTLLQEHEVRRDWFHPMPFERILIILFVELPPLSSSFSEAAGLVSRETTDSQSSSSSTTTTGVSGNAERRASAASQAGQQQLTLQQQLPMIFCHVLHCLRPERATSFVFSWLEMLAHRWFVGRVLAAPGCSPELRAAYQAMYAHLLVDLLKFLGYFLQNAIMPKPIQCLYKATLRLFLVLIHDFPEFVSDYYALFCDVVPCNSIQMRNLILSALPKRGIPSADPLQAILVDQLSSLEDPTGYCMEAGSRLPKAMRLELDAYLANRAPLKLLSELVTMLRRTDDLLLPLPSQYPGGGAGSASAAAAAAVHRHRHHQQALASYVAALATSDHVLSGSSSTTGTSKPEDEQQVGSEASDAGGPPMEVADIVETAATSSNTRSLSTGSSAAAAAAALLWGVRATQQLATFGLTDGMHYNVELMTNLTLYVCITAIRSLREKGMPLNMSTIAHTPQMDIIQSLVLNLDNEGRYLLLNCMANQLRYPNSHTYYFSYTILYLFSEQSKEQVKEQISRVLMERLIVNRPHPWGLLMTSAELLRNPAYRFWEHDFAHCNPEIEAIMIIVARSCIPNFQLPSLAPGHTPGLRPPGMAPTTVGGSGAHRQTSPMHRSGGGGGAASTGGGGGGLHSSATAPLLTD